MKVVIQRVKEASVIITEKKQASINTGLLILVGIENDDELEDINWLCKKIANLRIFNDDEGQMNRSVIDVDGELLVVSQFTLQASTKKGNRPSFIKAARPETAIPLYEIFVKTLSLIAGRPVQEGIFGADMEVGLINDGPVTIIIDSKNRV